MEKTSGILQLEINNECFILERDQHYLLGKRVDVNCTNFICLESEKLDMKHCLIEVNQNGDIFLIDLFSASGTFVNDQRLQALKKIPLKSNENIKLGDQIVRLSQNKIDEGDSSGFLESNRSLSKNSSNSLDGGQLLMTNTSINTNKTCNNSNIIIPETQFVKEPDSYDSNLNNDHSETLLNDHRIKDKMCLSVLDNTNQDCCIPETQEVSPERCDDSTNNQECNNHNIHDVGPSLNKYSYSNNAFTAVAPASAATPAPAAAVIATTSFAMPRADKVKVIITDENDLINEGSQFRICTPDFNDVNSIDDMDPQIQSQILSIILNKNINENSDKVAKNTNEIQMEKSIEQQQKQQSEEEQKEKFNKKKQNQLRNDMITPDFSYLEKLTPELSCDNSLDGCVEDFQETQKFPDINKKEQINTPANISTNISVSESKMIHKKFNDKSDQIDLAVGDKHSKKNDNILSTNQNYDDIDEDDLLTQELLKPTNSKNINNNNKFMEFSPIPKPIESITAITTITKTSASTPSITTQIANYHNSTMLNDATCTNLNECFDDNDATPNALKMIKMNKSFNQSVDNVNKPIAMLTPKDLAKAAINVSNTDSDVDFLKCTPQIINMHINITETRQLNVNKLNITTPIEKVSKSKVINDTEKSSNNDNDNDNDDNNDDSNNNNNGDDNNDDDNDVNDNVASNVESNENCVALLKPKDTKDFEILLKNLNVPQATQNVQSNTITKLKHQHDNDVAVAKPKINKSNIKRLVVKVKQDLTKAQKLENTLEKGTNKWHKKHDINAKNNKKLIVKLHRINTNKFDFGRFSSSSSFISNQKPIRKSKANTNSISNSSLTNPKKESKVTTSRLSETRSRLRSSKEIVTSESSTQDDIPTQPLERRTSKEILKKRNATNESRISVNDMRTLQKRKISTNIMIEEKPMKRAKQIELTDDDIITQPLPSTSFRKSNKKLQISTSMIEPNIMEDLLKHSKGFWSIASDPTTSEILIMDKGCRTYKFLLAMAKGIPIVTTQWLHKVNKNQKLMPFEDDFLNDKDFEKRYKCSILQSLRQVSRRRKPLFYGYVFAVTSNVLPIPQEIKTLIECSGGQVYINIKRETTLNIATLYLISCVEDKKDWHTHRRLCKNLIIITTEAIMAAIMQQSLDSLSKHVLH